MKTRVVVCASLLMLGTAAGLSRLLPAKVARNAPTAEWRAQVAKSIRDSEYQFTPVGVGTVSAPNRAQDLRATLTPDGMRLAPRTRPEETWRLELKLSGIGRPGTMETPGASTVQATGNRAESERPGVVEWYRNDVRGIEQGFSVTEPPSPARAGQPLVLEMTVDGTLKPELIEGGAAVLFRDAGGSAQVRYDSLHVLDARGVVVASRLALDRDRARVRIEVVDEGAQYPLAIDPLLTSPSWSSESNQAEAQLGVAVTTAGDINGDGYSDVLVGADGFDQSPFSNCGKAYLFTGSSTGLSTSALWSATGTLSGARLGAALAPAGDINGDGYDDVIISAPTHHGAGDQQGRVYVYTGAPSGLFASWQADGDQDFDGFGSAVAGAADFNADGYADIVIGAPRYSVGTGSSQGKVFVWYGSASGLGSNGTPSNADWTADGDQDGGSFGASVGTANVNADAYGTQPTDDLIVGAPLYDDAQTDEGKVFVYLGASSGLATTAVWTAESDQAGAQFGSSVAGLGDADGDGYAEVLIGAPLYDGGQTDEGRIYVYRGTSSGPSTVTYWYAESDQAGAKMGTSVATAGDIDGDGLADALAGAPYYDTTQTDAGRAYLFRGAVATGVSPVTSSPSWTADGTESSEDFGFSVATAGDVNGDGFSEVVIGALLYDNGQNDEGGAFVFHGSPAGVGTNIAWVNQGLQANAQMGLSAASAGDVNGDGFSDVVVGSHLEDFTCSTVPYTNAGEVLVYHGTSTGLPNPISGIARQINCLAPAQSSAEFGFSVAPAGDVNGDGYDDIIVGAPYYDNGQTDEGRAFVVLGCAQGLDASPAWTAEIDQAGALFGWSVASAGDVNADGYSDIIIGAPGWDGTGNNPNQGRAFLWLGGRRTSTDPDGLGANGTTSNADVTLTMSLKDSEFGTSVASAGDVNGDGKSDVIVGAPLWESTGSQKDEGAAFVFLGTSTGLNTTAAWSVESNQTSGDLGRSVAGAGDVNGDGYSDVVVGAPKYNTTLNQQGRATLYLGASGGLSSSASWTAVGSQMNSHLGQAVASAGDVNGDGFSDVIVGAPAEDSGQTDEGMAFVYHGASGGLNTSYATALQADIANANFGISVASAGDVNGDGFGDVLVGANLSESGANTDEGQAYLFLGDSSEGIDRIPQQVRGSGDGLVIGILGGTYSPTGTSFELRARGRTPAGRGKVRLQWEVKTLGTAFNGSGVSQGSVFLTGAVSSAGSSVGLAGAVSGLSSGTSYRWRMRIRGLSPYFPGTPWMYHPMNGGGEADLKTVGGTAPVNGCDNCTGPCLATWCPDADHACHWTDTCQVGGCCEYECGDDLLNECGGADICTEHICSPPC